MAQNLTFGYQGLPFGINLGDGDDKPSAAASALLGGSGVAGTALGAALAVLLGVGAVVGGI